MRTVEEDATKKVIRIVKRTEVRRREENMNIRQEKILLLVFLLKVDIGSRRP
jgi:hypothetical protein